MKKVIQELNNIFTDSFILQSKEFADKILFCEEDVMSSNLYVMGVGKDRILADYLSLLLRSVGFKSFTLNPFSGEEKCLAEEDLLLIISREGNNEDIISFLQESSFNNVFLVTQNPINAISSFCKGVFLLPEIDFPTISLQILFLELLIEYYIEDNV